MDKSPREWMIGQITDLPLSSGKGRPWTDAEKRELRSAMQTIIDREDPMTTPTRPADPMVALRELLAWWRTRADRKEQCGLKAEAERDRVCANELERTLAATPPAPDALRLAREAEWQALVMGKLLRAHDNFDDDEDTDIGREWLDALTLLGLMRKVRRGLWEITEAGEAAVRAAIEPSEEQVRRVTDKAMKRMALAPSGDAEAVEVVTVPYEKVARVAPSVDADAIALAAATDICAMGLCHTRGQLIAQMQVRIAEAIRAALRQDGPK